MPSIEKKMREQRCHEVHLHQCSYGLMLRDSQGRYGPCKKPTRIIGNLHTLKDLAQSCTCKKQHVHAVGGVRTPSGWRRRSDLGGITPCSCAADTPAQQTRHFGLNVMVVVPFSFLQFFKSKGTDVVKL